MKSKSLYRCHNACVLLEGYNVTPEIITCQLPRINIHYLSINGKFTFLLASARFYLLVSLTTAAALQLLAAWGDGSLLHFVRTLCIWAPIYIALFHHV